MCETNKITVEGVELQLTVSKAKLRKLPKRDRQAVASFIAFAAKYVNYKTSK